MNSDLQKTKPQLIEEVESLRAQVQMLEAQVSDLKNTSDGSEEKDSRQRNQHYLKRELFDLIKKDNCIFDFFQRGALDGIWYWDLENPGHEWMSPEFWRLFGYEPHEMQHLASEWKGMIFQEDLEVAIDNFNKHCADPDYPFDQLVRYHHKDGSTVWVRCRGVAIRDEQGRPIRMLGAHNDFTKLKEREQELKANEERYRALYNAIMDPVLVANAETGIIVECNRAAEEMFGRPSSELVGIHQGSLHPPEDMTPEGITYHFKRNLQDSELTQEIRFIRPDGSIRSAEVRTGLFQIQEKNLMLGIFRDVTEARKSEQALRFSEEHHRLLTDNVQDIIWKRDEDLRLTYISPSVESVLGFTPEEAMAATPEQRFTPDSLKMLAELREELQDALVRGQADTFQRRLELKGLHKNGHSVWFEVDARSITDDKGRFLHLIGVSRDITERKQAEAAFWESEGRIRRKLKAILNPEEGMAELELSDIIDSEALQSMMDNFYQVTGIGIGVIDMKGNVLVATGWQDICTRFHRVHPDTAHACKESDLRLSSGVSPGEFRLYRCKNNMWDIATPLMVGDKHMGNIFLGQFFFEDEEPDREAFRRQAQLYGFDEQEYLDALDRVPRWSRERIDTVMRFYSQFTDTIASLSYGNIKLSWAKAEKDKLYEEMRMQQERLSLAVEMANMGCWEMDLSSKSFTFNGQFYSLYATTSDQEGGFVMSAEDYVQRFVHPDEADIIAKEISNITSGMYDEQPAQVEHRIIRRDGKLRHIVVRFIVLNNAEGKRVKTVGVNQDITEMKMAGRALKESEEKFRSAFDSSPDAVNINRLSDGLYVEINQGFTELTGYTRGDVCGKTSKDIDIWCDFKDRERLVSELKRHGFCSNIQTEFRKKDKSTTTALMSARVITLNDEPHIISITRDISESIKAANDLAEAHMKLNFHIENSPLAVIEWANGTQVSKWSKQAENFFGWKAEEVIGKNWNDFKFIHPDDIEIVKSQVVKLFDGSDDFNTIANRNFHKDQSVLSCQWYNSPLRNPNGEILSILSLVADVTDLKKYEQSLLQAKEQAEAATKAKNEFLANMSHEIRTPMNGVLGMLQLLQTTNINEEQREYVLTAIQSSKRLTRLLSDILDLSKVEANHLSIQSQPLDLAEVISQTCELFKPTAQQTQVELLCYVDPKIPHRLNGDAARIQQVLTNIIGNAFKFTKEGRIAVEAYSLTLYAQNMRRVLFSISDTGIGISDDKVVKLFQPFSQVSMGYRRDYQGAGLGLSICKKLIELMGGSIAIESVPGEGTTVHFSVSFSVDESRLKPGVVSSSILSGAPLRILLAEDEDVNRFVTSKLIEKQGHTVVGVENGEEAISKLANVDFDLVIMDIQMPVMDGLEAIKVIRSGKAGTQNKDIPIFAMTAYAMVGDREIFLKAGVDDYLSKPVDIEKLNAALASVIDGSGTQA